MLIDLAQQSGDTCLEADVCVLGSGPAGLTLARALAVQGVSVAIVEKGPHTPELRPDMTDFVCGRREYKGATLGRAFGFGGTSGVWGGGLLPIRPAELSARKSGDATAWPIAYSDITEHFGPLQAWLGVNALPFDLEFARQTRHPLAALDWQGLDPRFLKWIPFRGRNLGAAWFSALRESGCVHGCINAIPVAFEITGAKGERRANRLLARSQNGREASISFDELIICAGALESPRLVRLLDAEDMLDERSKAHLGRYLHDHLSVRAANVEIIDRDAFLRRFAPAFSGNTMHTLRLELDAETRETESLPAAYAHFVAEAPEDSGFAVLRDLLRGMQQQGLAAAIPHLRRLPAALPEIAEIARWRFANKRLAFPRRATVSLMIDFEQPISANNRVYPGAAGSPWHLDWELGCRPGQLVEMMARRLSDWWSRNSLEQVARLHFLEPGEVESNWPSNLYDIYHPAGTTRMAASPDEGVVDCNLRVFGTQNVHVLSTSAFPSLGAANPTFTLMLLAMRLAGHLARRPGRPLHKTESFARDHSSVRREIV
jgi:choline dehydrogenase-like flavoprotein